MAPRSLRSTSPDTPAEPSGAGAVFGWALAAVIAGGAALLIHWSGTAPVIGKVFAARPLPVTAPSHEPARPAAAAVGQLAETEKTVRALESRLATLTATADVLLKRIDTLDGQLMDVTGTVRRQDHRVAALEAAPEPAASAPVPADPGLPDAARVPLRSTSTLIADPAPAMPETAPPETLPPAPPASRPMVLAVPFVREAISLPPAVHRLHHGESETAAAEAPRSGTQFGIDLGGAMTMDGLRTLWNETRRTHGRALQGLRPVIGIVENARAKTTEFRLIAGPLLNATAAGRLCAELMASGRDSCQATIYEGQRLVSR